MTAALLLDMFGTFGSMTVLRLVQLAIAPVSETWRDKW